jgi:hypothetical protein
MHQHVSLEQEWGGTYIISGGIPNGWNKGTSGL